MTKHTFLLLTLLLIVGCGDKDNKSVHRAGEQVGETVTDFAKGIGRGVDNSLEVKVELTEPVSKLGLETTVAKTGGAGGMEKNTITVYFIASRPVKTLLLAKALNADGDEVGRAAEELELDADDAKYVTFTFAPEMDSQRVEKYVLALRKSSSDSK